MFLKQIKIQHVVRDLYKNIRVLRFAEILLINAEAANELGNTGAASGFLNKVRNRAKLGDTTASSQAGLRTAIWHERRVELAMEGDRFVDLCENRSSGNCFSFLWL